jgi:RNA polymerase sigma-70 factor, ECF subfamily
VYRLASDEVLVGQTLDGDQRAYGVLVARHGDAARRAAARILRDDGDAEDACQDAFFAAYRSLAAFQPSGGFRSWLLRIVRNRAVDLLRRRQARGARPLALGVGDGELDLPSEEASPLLRAQRAELRATLERVLASLAPIEREVLLRHHAGGDRHRVIARRFGFDEATSRQYLLRARRRAAAALRRDLMPEA